MFARYCGAAVLLVSLFSLTVLAFSRPWDFSQYSSDDMQVVFLPFPPATLFTGSLRSGVSLPLRYAGVPLNNLWCSPNGNVYAFVNDVNWLHVRSLTDESQRWDINLRTLFDLSNPNARAWVVGITDSGDVVLNYLDSELKIHYYSLSRGYLEALSTEGSAFGGGMVSSDGRYFARDDRQQGIEVVALDSGERHLIKGGAVLGWMPGEALLWFTRGGYDETQVYLTDLEREFYVPWFNLYAGYRAALSPDGRTIASSPFWNLSVRSVQRAFYPIDTRRAFEETFYCFLRAQPALLTAQRLFARAPYPMRLDMPASYRP